MNKILVDTNILISAIVFDRNELDVILKGIKKGDSIHISEHITEEATRVILKKFPDFFELYENFLETAEIKIIPRTDYIDDINKIKGIRDKYDAHIIACAEKINCNFIITGDKDLLTFENTGIQIITSKQYLSKI